MNFFRKNFYLLSLAALVGLVGLIVLFREKQSHVPLLKNRTGIAGNGAEWLNTKQAIEGLIYRIEQNPDDLKSKIKLAQAYIQEGRITGDAHYYDPAALRLLNEVLKKQPEDFEALCAKATVLLSQHNFKEALAVGRETQKLYPHAAFVYGILTDAYVELGDYENAVIAVDSMCAIRPDLRSYSRVSYVREIYGDFDGAKEAMKMAVEAGVPGMEQTEWCRINLGKLYEHTGHLDTAQMIYEAANSVRPNYAHAIAALARIELAKKNYPKSIELFEQANSLLKGNFFGQELMALYQLSGDEAKAKKMLQETVRSLLEHAHEAGDKNPHDGHYKELASLYLQANEFNEAMKYAKEEYERRPENIEVNELMGWLLYRQGKFTEAVPYIEKAMHTGSKNPELLCRAGLVYIHVNQTEKGSALITTAVGQNPYIEEGLMNEVTPFVTSPVSSLAVN